MEKEDAKIEEQVKEYYGKTLQSTKDLKTTACCPTGTKPSKQNAKILQKIHTEILERFYGCGSPIPPLLKGAVVIDLGCGVGRDSYLVSALVGEEGKVIGIDMTKEQLEVANRHIEYQMKQFGYEKNNIEFKEGKIEDLKALAIADESVDVVISNCVINLSANKEKVFSEIFRVLKEGGELYFSDVFADRRIPQNLKEDSLLWGECLTGALYIEDFRRIAQKVGFFDFRIVSKFQITVENKEIEKQLGDIAFFSITIRAFKLESLEDKCEDFGQTATYKGGIEGIEEFVLDDHHVFKVGEVNKVCGNTADMLSLTRFSPFFDVTPKGTHKGLFDCSQTITKNNSSACC